MKVTKKCRKHSKLPKVLITSRKFMNYLNHSKNQISNSTIIQIIEASNRDFRNSNYLKPNPLHRATEKKTLNRSNLQKECEDSFTNGYYIATLRLILFFVDRKIAAWTVYNFTFSRKYMVGSGHSDNSSYVSYFFWIYVMYLTYKFLLLLLTITRLYTR